MVDPDRFEHCEGALPCPAGSSAFNIKGELYRNMATALVHYDKLTEGAVNRALAEESVLEHCEQHFLASSLYDAIPMPWLMIAFCKAIRRDVRDFTRVIGTRGIELQMSKGVYRQSFGRMAVHNFHRIFPALVSGMYDFGPIEITNDQVARRARLVRGGMPACLGEWWSLMSRPYIRVPLEKKHVQGLKIDYRFEFDSVARGPLAIGTVIWDIAWDE